MIHRCFRCGYCKFTSDYSDFNCPTYNKFSFETFSPGGRMWLLRAWLNEEIGWSDRLGKILYSCVTCGNCVEHCVMKFNEDLVNIVVAARREMIERGTVPPAVRDCLKSIHIHGNPYKESAEDRGGWAEGLDIPAYSGQEYLFYVGCVGSFDERGQKIARAVGNLLNKAGLSMGILGSRELCDGNEVNVLGESGLFKMLAENNIQLFKELGVKNIVTLDPHSYNAFKNEYPSLGGDFEVLHYTQLAAKLIDSSKLSLPKVKAAVTYHDPCYLGRHNDEFNAPRTILRNIPGLSFVEMERRKKDSFCCGGGGGNFFTDMIGAGERSPGRVRIREAVETGAEILAVACPLCAKMFEDALKAEDLEDKIQVSDIAELAGSR